MLQLCICCEGPAACCTHWLFGHVTTHLHALISICFDDVSSLLPCNQAFLGPILLFFLFRSSCPPAVSPFLPLFCNCILVSIAPSCLSCPTFYLFPCPSPMPFPYPVPFPVTLSNRLPYLLHLPLCSSCNQACIFDAIRVHPNDESKSRAML